MQRKWYNESEVPQIVFLLEVTKCRESVTTSRPEASQVSNLICIRPLDDSMKGTRLCGQFDVCPFHLRANFPTLPSLFPQESFPFIVFTTAVPLFNLPHFFNPFLATFLGYSFLIHPVCATFPSFCFNISSCVLPIDLHDLIYFYDNLATSVHLLFLDWSSSILVHSVLLFLLWICVLGLILMYRMSTIRWSEKSSVFIKLICI